MTRIAHYNMIRALVLTGTLVWIAGKIMAYQTQQIDSLIQLLDQNLNHDSNRVINLNKLSHAYWNVEPKKTVALALEAQELAEKIGYRRGIAQARYEQGVGHWMLAEYDQAYASTTLALKDFEPLNELLAVSNCYSMLALIMDDQGEYSKSINLHRQSIAQKEPLGDTSGIARTLNNIGGIYFKQGNLDSAQLLFEHSLGLRMKLKSERDIRESYSNLSVLHRQKGELKKAQHYIEKALVIADKLNLRNGIINSKQNLAAIYLERDQVDSAEYIYREILPMARDMGIQKREMEILLRLRSIEERKGNYRQALSLADEYWQVRDSVHGKDASEKIAILEAQYESEKKEKEIAALQQSAKNRTLWRNIFAIGILASLIFAALIFLSFRYRTQKNAAILQVEKAERVQLEEMNALRSRFFANISHEFRTPLTLITGPIQQLIERTNSENDRHLLRVVQRSAARLMKLINQLLDLSKMEAGQLTLEANLQDIIPPLKGWTMAFQTLAEEKDIQLRFHTESESCYIYFESEKIEQAFTNLLSNAFKFTPSHGRIDVIITPLKKANQDFLSIAVRDSGLGIPKEAQGHIFDRFYQAHTYEEGSGTGIGLSLAQDFVKLHHGILEVDSIPDMGSTFTMLLPLGRDHLTDQEVNLIATPVTVPGQEPKSAEAATQWTPNDQADQLKLLIVEDNRDLRQYLQTILGDTYGLIEAADGSVGVEIAQKEVPDIILSDVMMPKLNGIELCKALKENIKTSHIPIVLLTAKSKEEDRLLALENLADAYLTKPFNAKELLAVLQNLVANRQKLQQKFQMQMQLRPEKVDVNSVDQQFLSALTSQLEDHIDDDLFGVEQLASALKMSRSQLHRKLKAMADVNPSQFIRTFRLHRAKDLLEANAGSVSEIAFRVGFNSSSYFAKCFQEQFGVLPKEILKK